jgi:hypothetical protein
MLTGYSDGVYAVVFSADGGLVASGGETARSGSGMLRQECRAARSRGIGMG